MCSDPKSVKHGGTCVLMTGMGLKLNAYEIVHLTALALLGKRKSCMNWIFSQLLNYFQRQEF